MKPLLCKFKNIPPEILLTIASLLMFTLWLGGREIWTLETRWANIVLQMISSKDYFHPMLMGQPYYDKPLLSYWLILFCKITIGHLSLFALRLPSAVAAIGTIGCVYRLGCSLFNKQIAMIASWLLLTTYYFVFWGRVASADMLNLFGTYAAVVWAIEHYTQTRFRDYLIFFIIISLTSLCKGLLGIVLPGLMLSTWLIVTKRSYYQHVNLASFFAACLGAFVYVLPFIVSSMTSDHHYVENGLWLVFRENIVRFFHPWDHEGPFYLYFIYVPIYALPWSFFLVQSVRMVLKESATQVSLRWLLLCLTTLFLFFSMAGSRRSYYCLPMIPLVLLMIAYWVDSVSKVNPSFQRLFYKMLFTIYVVWLLLYVCILPLYYSRGGPASFVSMLEKQTEYTHANYYLIDSDNKIPFYLGEEAVINFSSLSSFVNSPPKLGDHTPNILITTESNAQTLRDLLDNHYHVDYQVVHTQADASSWRRPDDLSSRSIAFILGTD